MIPKRIMETVRKSHIWRRSHETESEEETDEYLVAMKRVQNRNKKTSDEGQVKSPRERHRSRSSDVLGIMEGVSGCMSSLQQATRISTVASMVPDEIIYSHWDRTIRSYETALMFIDVSGFTDLCESYTRPGRGGPSRLTQVLNSYIGAMIQEILMHNGDILNFSGDAFLTMWKKTPKVTMQNIVHTAIDCGLLIQKNYENFITDTGVVLKVKIAISAGLSHFSIIGDEGKDSQSHYVIVGQPVWDVKMAEYMSTAGDVLTSASAWMYVNEAEYCTQPCRDGRHTKVLGIGATWKRVENPLNTLSNVHKDSDSVFISPPKNQSESEAPDEKYLRGFSLRPSVVSALKNSWWHSLRPFMATPVLRAVDNDEPMDFLTEVRRVVVVFLNIVTKSVTEGVLIGIVDSAYKCVCRLSSAVGGLVNKVSMFDKDMMFLVIFGLRGLKQEDEARKALQCAYELMESLTVMDINIMSVSIGVTSGTTYCGVVGHVLRREYTVIGPTVNKAARLMMAYPMRVTCDKETFLRSKLEQDHFRIVEQKALKGISKPGPIYEFDKYRWSERKGASRHPILGRNDELRKYKTLINNAITEHKRRFTRFRDLKFAFAIIGVELVGKSRFLEECISITPHEYRVETFVLTENDNRPFALFRKLMTKAFTISDARNSLVNFEDILRFSVNLTDLTALQLFALNMIFDCHFPLPEKFEYHGNCLYDLSVKLMLQDIFKSMFPNLWVAAVKMAHYIDDHTWRMLIIMLETKTIFLIMTINEEHRLSETACTALENNMIVKILLKGINRWYHGALACQLLDVQAIPSDLEKIIESASGGLPGWIQNFVISLVQRGVLTVVTVLRNEAKESGAVMPSPALLQRAAYDSINEKYSLTGTSYHSIYSGISTASRQEPQYNGLDTDVVQMAVLADGYTFDDMNVDMSMDAIILKTYDSLTSFEKMLLKCGSVLGDVFSRRMLHHLMQSDSPRKVAQAVAKLLLIRVLECEGGDFTRDVSMVLVRPAPALPASKPPYCACLGIRPPPSCRDLPSYAFCGYMKFRHAMFRTTTYDLLTESQKREMHARALLYLERYTRRCVSCGLGCFAKLLGERSDDGLVVESEALRRTKQQICALNAEAKGGIEDESASQFHPETSELTINNGKILSQPDLSSDDMEDRKNFRQSITVAKKNRHVRSFSSIDFSTCECLSILLAAYSQIVDHCRGAGEYEKLFEAYLEYADLNIINQNIPQAIRLLFEVETFVINECFSNKLLKWDWIRDFRLAAIYSLRGSCMLHSGDIIEARKYLLYAMELYHNPFPNSRYSAKICNLTATVKQRMILYFSSYCYVGKESGMVGRFYDDIARTLSTLYTLFSETKENNNAELAAKCSLNYALKTNANFRVMCHSYGGMITTYRQNKQFSMCEKLEKRAIEMCHRKRGQIDVTEVPAVSYLYSSIFLFYVEHGKKMESLEFGLSVMHMLSALTNSATCQVLLLWMLKLLLSDLRIQDMVNIMRQFFYVPDHYDLSSETWYYYYAMVVMLDTGYYVETYGTCERFYLRKGDAILRARTPEAAWSFFVCMWLVTVRVGTWEKSILWEEKIWQIVAMKLEKNEFNMMILIRLAEGLIITLVKEMDNRNIKAIFLLEKTLKGIFQDLYTTPGYMTMFKPRYYFLYAYFHYVRGKKYRGFNYLNKCVDFCKQLSLKTLLIWANHTLNHWKGTLNPKLENYWVEHIEPEQILDYRDFDLVKSKIVPYTLPLPKDFEIYGD